MSEVEMIEIEDKENHFRADSIVYGHFKEIEEDKLIFIYSDDFNYSQILNGRLNHSGSSSMKVTLLDLKGILINIRIQMDSNTNPRRTPKG